MTVKQLNKEQRRQLKIKFREELDGHILSYDDIVNIESIVSDGEIDSWYEGIDFVEDDFWGC